MPEPPIDPPDDEYDYECPACDAIAVEWTCGATNRELACCEVCGWSNEPDWSMQDDQD
tara:strand:- start:189 stop:362 length:174 start_codon:yes stop_codon:yes gene_type:complete